MKTRPMSVQNLDIAYLLGDTSLELNLAGRLCTLGPKTIDDVLISVGLIHRVELLMHLPNSFLALL